MSVSSHLFFFWKKLPCALQKRDHISQRRHQPTHIHRFYCRCGDLGISVPADFDRVVSILSITSIVQMHYPTQRLTPQQFVRMIRQFVQHARSASFVVRVSEPQQHTCQSLQDFFTGSGIRMQQRKQFGSHTQLLFAILRLTTRQLTVVPKSKPCSLRDVRVWNHRREVCGFNDFQELSDHFTILLLKFFYPCCLLLLS